MSGHGEGKRFHLVSYSKTGQITWPIGSVLNQILYVNSTTEVQARQKRGHSPLPTQRAMMRGSLHLNIIRISSGFYWSRDVCYLMMMMNCCIGCEHRKPTEIRRGYSKIKLALRGIAKYLIWSQLDNLQSLTLAHWNSASLFMHRCRENRKRAWSARWGKHKELLI